ncbi:MAG: hypothetical protein ABI175_17085 [Polyangiales bacterium]
MSHRTTRHPGWTIVVSTAACAAACSGPRAPSVTVAPAASSAGAMEVCVDDGVRYEPQPLYSGPKGVLPTVPRVPGVDTYHDGAAWTVYGLQHQLHNPNHRAEVDMKPASVIGFVVDVYRPTEPTGKAGCIYPTKKHPPTWKHPTPPGVDCSKVSFMPPHFSIADRADEKNPAKWITVMGYASTYIQQAMAVAYYDAHPKVQIGSAKEDDLYMDSNYSSFITILGEPRLGSRVTVSGLFGHEYVEGQGGRRSVPSGIIDATSFKNGKIECDQCIDRLPLR